MRIRVSGVCGTDYEVVHGLWEPIVAVVRKFGVTIPGHEGVGVVEEVGPGVTLLGKGDRVGVPMLSDWCGACGYCLGGLAVRCPHRR